MTAILKIIFLILSFLVERSNTAIAREEKKEHEELDELWAKKKKGKATKADLFRISVLVDRKLKRVFSPK